MKKLLISLTFVISLSLFAQRVSAQGWPADYAGVMLQGFSWDDFDNAQWTEIESQSDELANFFSLIWVPQSGNCGGKSMGYNPLYYYDHDSSFGTETQLRSMIKTLKSKGVGTIADVVVNHRNTMKNWFDFPAETYNGVTYQMFSTDVCADDDGGNAAKQATAQGVQLSPNKDTGEDFGGYRDLDHTSENVQQNIFAYEEFLLNDLGYTGFRYDVAKGFAAKYFGMYNAKAKPEFSVGEYWDGDPVKVRNWVNGTKVDGVIQSAAFDFPFRYRVRDAFNNSGEKFAELNKDCLIKIPTYRRYAVTFVENHDTQDRRPVGGDKQDPLVDANIPASNAAMLAMPGTPCVFQPHWLNYKTDIKKMILARKMARITNTSDYTTIEASANRFVVECGDLLAVIGKNDADKAAELGFSLVTSGSNYYYYLRNSLETVFISEPDGVFDASKTPTISVELSAISADSNAKVIYTINGSEPVNGSKSSYEVASGYELKISENTTLKVGLLMSNGEVKNVQSRTYKFTTPPPFEAHDATVYVKADFTPVYFYIWDSNNNTQLNGDWPGKRMDNVEANKVEIDGEVWLKQTVHIDKEGYYFNFIINQGSGKPQTADITRLSSDKFYTATIVNSKVSYTDVTSQHTTAIDQVVASPASSLSPIYTIDGRVIGKNVTSDERNVDLPRGLYIINGKKVIKQ